MEGMKPEDVMRALECCNKEDVVLCAKCPYAKEENDEFCANRLLKDALILLREKDAEIERLKEEYEITQETHFGKITIPKIRSLGEGAEWVYKKIRAEAIDEFAERMKEHFELSYIRFRIDETAKELKGD